jgi:serine/threonine-protein kinase HipA
MKAGISLRLKCPLPMAHAFLAFQNYKRQQDTFKGLPDLLADALPDKYGNNLINTWLAQNARPAESMNPVEKLCFIGTRGMGALEFEAAQMKSGRRSFALEVSSLVDIARKISDSGYSF